MQPTLVRTRHLAALDGLRAVAILLVVVLHVAGATGTLSSDALLWRMAANGGVGVTIFFVLSGFLLYRPFARAALDGSPPPSVRRYLRRRALRILPAYWLMLAFTLLVFTENRPHAGSARTWLEFLTLTHPYDPGKWWQGLGPRGLGPMWSLSVEASFYLLLPVLARLLHRWARGSAARLLAGIAVLGALSLAEAIAVRCGGNIDLLFANEQLLPRSLVIFAAGMALAVLAERPTALSEAAGAAPGIGWVVALCLLALVSTPLATPGYGPQNAAQYVVTIVLYPLIALALVAPAALAPAHPLTTGLLANGPLVQLGLVSYGVFLWHSPVIESWYALTGRPAYAGDFWLLLLVVLAVSLVIASLSHTFVEEPAQRLGR
ncbi:acyltransferase [Actinocorallia longicatena]|uniref:Acyltransferase n=1 Tax=Actinocorallia longicatena TaxID=111803 RepID=A0ABP6QIK9_9ACTN